MLGATVSTDHKRIGLTLGVCSLFFFLLGGVFALLMRTQLAQPDMQFVSDNSYNQLFTMHGSTMIYLFVTPMAIAMAIYLVPLQIGAVGLSGARLALAGMWTWLCGGLVMQQGWFASGGAGRDGWSSYAPLSNGTNTPGVGTGPVGDRRHSRGRGHDRDGGVHARYGRTSASARDVTTANAGVHLDRTGQRPDGGRRRSRSWCSRWSCSTSTAMGGTSTPGSRARSTTRICSGSSVIQWCT